MALLAQHRLRATSQEKLGTPAIERSADLVGQQTVESGRIDVKPEMAYRVDMGHSVFIEPKIMVGTFWNLGDAASWSHGRAARGAAHGRDRRHCRYR